MSVEVFVRGSRPLPSGLVPRPPAVEGDLLRAIERGAGAVIVAARGVPAPWPEEVASAVARGLRVIVAGEGALLGVELEGFGVEGVGALVERARSLSDDALHFPTEVEASDAWLPADLEDAARELGLDPRLVAAHRAQPPRARSLRLAIARSTGEVALVERLASVARTSERDLSRAIARAGEPRPTPPRRVAPRTLHVEKLAHQVWMERALSPAGEPPFESLTRSGETYGVSRKKLLLRLLARGEARRIGLAVKPEEVAAFTADWRRKYGFEQASELQAYLDAEGVTVEELMRIMEDFALLVRLETAYDAEIREGMRAHVAVQAARGRS